MNRTGRKTEYRALGMFKIIRAHRITRHSKGPWLLQSLRELKWPMCFCPNPFLNSRVTACWSEDTLVVFRDLELGVSFWYILLLSLPRIAVSYDVCVLAINLCVSQQRLNME